MTLVYKGVGELNERASMLVNQPIHGPAVIHFGGVKGKTLHSLLRPGESPLTYSNNAPANRVGEEFQMPIVERCLDSLWLH